MKERKIILGCDLSKDKIDIATIKKLSNKILSEKTETNNLKGFKNIIKPYSSVIGEIHVIVEATGNYH
ncbi:MAG: hypothetical protein KAI45_10590, partial [Melioribacteraceae bacterium]|nr:hypothetical protein [Melioribacteraceae bacterium]